MTLLGNTNADFDVNQNSANRKYEDLLNLTYMLCYTYNY